MRLSIFLAVIFIVLSGFHFYWLFGGKWGVDQVIPTKESESEATKIPKLATLIVALGLLSIASLYFLKAGVIDFTLPNWISKFVYWIIPILFLFRAIGDFNYVGFFKKVKNTKFAIADSKIFSPLCFFIGVSGLIIQFSS